MLLKRIHNQCETASQWESAVQLRERKPVLCDSGGGRMGWEVGRKFQREGTGVCAVLSRSVVSDSATPWTGARQVPLSVEFSRREYWSVLPLEPSNRNKN